MLPLVIVIGLAAALLIYVTATPEAIDHGQQLRKAASGVGEGLCLDERMTNRVREQGGCAKRAAAWEMREPRPCTLTYRARHGVLYNEFWGGGVEQEGRDKHLVLAVVGLPSEVCTVVLHLPGGEQRALITTTWPHILGIARFNKHAVDPAQAQTGPCAPAIGQCWTGHRFPGPCKRHS
jgi:hypothetical protein